MTAAMLTLQFIALLLPVLTCSARAMRSTHPEFGASTIALATSSIAYIVFWTIYITLILTPYGVLSVFATQSTGGNFDRSLWYSAAVLLARSETSVVVFGSLLANLFVHAYVWRNWIDLSESANES